MVQYKIGEIFEINKTFFIFNKLSTFHMFSSMRASSGQSFLDENRNVLTKHNKKFLYIKLTDN